ncbi:hypothetical protein DAI22_02g384700 [Oryza sativa Japonica Group]|nr:hypothetical protein DAI22_02g384700 [Oryza sativa Japonica Group]
MRFECPKMATGSWRKRGRMKLGDDAASALWSEWHRPPSHASRRPPASRLAHRRCPQPSSSFSSLPSELAGHTAPDPLNPKLAGHSVARFTPVGGEPEERGRRRGSRGRRPRRPCRAGRGGGGEALEPPVASGIGVRGASGRGGQEGRVAAASPGARRPLRGRPVPPDLRCRPGEEGSAATTMVAATKLRPQPSSRRARTSRRHWIWQAATPSSRLVAATPSSRLVPAMREQGRPRSSPPSSAKLAALPRPPPSSPPCCRASGLHAKTAAIVSSLPPPPSSPDPPTLRPATPAPSPLATAPPGPVAVEAAAPLERLSAGSARA